MKGIGKYILRYIIAIIVALVAAYLVYWIISSNADNITNSFVPQN